MSFTFDTVGLYVVTINDKPWIRARKVCRALKFEKQLDELLGTTVPAKKFSIKISWWSCPR